MFRLVCRAAQHDQVAIRCLLDVQLEQGEPHLDAEEGGVNVGAGTACMQPARNETGRELVDGEREQDDRKCAAQRPAKSSA